MSEDAFVRASIRTDNDSPVDMSPISTSPESPTRKKRHEDGDGRLFNQIESVLLGGLETAVVTRDGLADFMVTDCLDRRGRHQPPRLVFSSNGQGIALASSDQAFNSAIRQADLIHADGMSVVLASKFVTGKPLPERVPTTDFFHDAARSGQTSKLRFYMLGGKEEVNREAFDRARKHYPDVDWVGRHHGYFTRDDEERICAEIVAAGTDVLWLALGRPHQEYFALRNRDRLRGVGWIKTCGGLFDFLAGVNKRAPRWMQRICMEWFWRMMQEPQRLLWRYIKTNVQAVICLATQSEGRKIRTTSSHAQRPYHRQT
ncbi:MAG: WecB/TagA/CpsF family glycosyltransferase [Pseudomonadota bacterium]